MIIDGLDMKYVIGFPIINNKILLIKRNNYPWVNKWNGVGGKIEENETPVQAFYREILEETGVDLNTCKTRFTGIVTWDINEEGDNNAGMYSYLSELPNDQIKLDYERKINEGIIALKSIKWASDKNNKELADNIPYFLPLMMVAKIPKRYHCVFRNNELREINVSPLPKVLKIRI